MMKRIIDVSEYQGKIDWEAVKPHIDGAILRCGYGMDFARQDDSFFRRNADECTRLGIPFGVYLYSYADTEEKAASEADHVLRLVKGYRLRYPIYLDLEERGTEEGAMKRAVLFGDRLEKAGYWCGVYANLNWWETHLKGLERFTKWVAQYYSRCEYTGNNLDMWQYSSRGTVPGIAGNVDMNKCYRDFPAEISGTAKKQETYTLEQFIREVQAATGSRVDGIAGPETIGNTVTVSASINSTHPVVPAVQKRLAALGYAEVGTADGIAGPRFASAVAHFQQDNGCRVDGEATAANRTWRKLLEME